MIRIERHKIEIYYNESETEATDKEVGGLMQKGYVVSEREIVNDDGLYGWVILIKKTFKEGIN